MTPKDDPHSNAMLSICSFFLGALAVVVFLGGDDKSPEKTSEPPEPPESADLKPLRDLIIKQQEGLLRVSERVKHQDAQISAEQMKREALVRRVESLEQQRQP